MKIDNNIKFAVYTTSIILIAAQAFRLVPEGNPPSGVYAAGRDDHGNLYTKYLGPLDTMGWPVEARAPSDGTHGIDMDPVLEAKCTGSEIPPNETYTVLEGLKGFCDTGRWVDDHVVFVAGNTIAYACKWQDQNMCYANVTDHAYFVAFQTCGRNKTARWTSLGPPAMMYGFDKVGWNICCDDDFDTNCGN